MNARGQLGDLHAASSLASTDFHFSIDGSRLNSPRTGGSIRASVSRKRALSSSPYSDSFDINSMIRFSPNSLATIVNGSRSSSASGSYGHLSAGTMSPTLGGLHAAAAAAAGMAPHIQQLQAHLLRAGGLLHPALTAGGGAVGPVHHGSPNGSMFSLPHHPLHTSSSGGGGHALPKPSSVRLSKVYLKEDLAKGYFYDHQHLMSVDEHHMHHLHHATQMATAAAASKKHHQELPSSSTSNHIAMAEADSATAAAAAAAAATGKKGRAKREPLTIPRYGGNSSDGGGGHCGANSSGDGVADTTDLKDEPGDFIETNCHWRECGMEFGTQEELVKHINNDHIHINKKSFVCRWDDCSREEKPFKAQYMLVVHMRRHTGEKPHKCTVSIFTIFRWFSFVFSSLHPLTQTLSPVRTFTCLLKAIKFRHRLDYIL